MGLKLRKYVPYISLKDKLIVMCSLLVGFAIVGWLAHSGLSIYRPKQIIERVVPPPEFKEVSGILGSQMYFVSVQTSTYDGPRMVLPFPVHECKNLMVIDLRFKERNQLALEKKLSSAEGVAKVQVFSNRIVVHRPCVANSPGLWKWEEVWQNTRPILLKHYENPQ